MRINRNMAVAVDERGSARGCAWLNQHTQIRQRHIGNDVWEMVTERAGLVTPIPNIKNGCNELVAGDDRWMRRYTAMQPQLNGSQEWIPTNGYTGDIDGDYAVTLDSEKRIIRLYVGDTFVREIARGVPKGNGEVRIRGTILSWLESPDQFIVHDIVSDTRTIAKTHPGCAKPLAFFANGRVWVMYHTDEFGGLIHPSDDRTHGYKFSTPMHVFDVDAHVIDRGLVFGWANDEGEFDCEVATIPVLGEGMTKLEDAPIVVPPPTIAPFGFKMWTSPVFSYSLRRREDGTFVYGDTDDPLGNAQTLVGGEGTADRQRELIREEVQKYSALGQPLIVVGSPQAVGNINLTIAWAASGATAWDLGQHIKMCMTLPAKPIIAYLDSGVVEDWPKDTPEWMNAQVWPQPQIYRRLNESVADFRVRAMALCDRVAAYGRPIALMLRTDDWNGHGSLRHTLEALPVYEELIRKYRPAAVHFFSDRRGKGLAYFPELRAWAKAICAAVSDRPSREDFWENPSISMEERLAAKLRQNVSCYQFSREEADFLIAAIDKN